MVLAFSSETLTPKEPSYVLHQDEKGTKNSFHTEASFLYWQAIEDGLEYAAKNLPRFNASSSRPTNLSAQLIAPDFDFNPGAKVVLGYHFAEMGWDLDGRWTWGFFKSTGSSSIDLESNGQGLFPLWIPQQAATTPNPVYQNSKAHLAIHLNNFDIELACSGAISDALFFKLHGGLKAIFITQTYDVSYQTGNIYGNNQMISSSAHLTNSCKGAGPRLGLGTRWQFPKGLSLLAEMSFAMALSDMKTDRSDHSISQVDGEIETIQPEMREGFWVWRPLIEGKTGLEWNYLFGTNNFFSLEASYEIQQYWEQNMMLRYADSALFYASFNSRGNLLLQGLTLSATIGF